MKIVFGIFRIISSIGFGFLALILLTSHFNLNDKFDRYSRLHDDGITTYATLSDTYSEVNFKVKMIRVKLFVFDYHFKVGDKAYGGKHSVTSLDSLQTKKVEVKYLISDPSVNSTDVNQEYEEIKKDIESKNSLIFGSILLLLFFFLLVSGIRKVRRGLNNGSPSSLKKNNSSPQRVINIIGFDKNGEPEIRLYKNNNLEIHFQFMPPLHGQDTQSKQAFFDTFDKKLSTIINKNVIWEDQELFIVKNATDLDMSKLKNYLESFWKSDSLY